MTRRLRLPRRPLAHDTVPLGRTVILFVFLAANVFLAYSWYQDGVRPPFATEQFVLTAQTRDAGGLHPDNDPPVSVAGVPVGRVVDVTYADGTATVKMRLDPSARGRVFKDAFVRVRPQNGTNVLAVDIRPGTRSAGALASGATIPVPQTAPPGMPDDVIDVLDADTRAYLSIVLSESGQALEGRGGDVSRALRLAAKAVDPAAEIAETLSRRKELVAALVGDVDVIFRTLARRREQLRTMLASSRTIMATTASQDQEIAAALRAAPGVLDEADRTAEVVSDVAPRLSRSFDRVLPVARKLGPSMRAAQRLLPEASRLITASGRLAREGDQPVADLLTVLRQLTEQKSSLTLLFSRLEAISGTLDAQKARAPLVSAVTSGIAGQQDNRSAMGRVLVKTFESPKPQNFGLPDTPAGRRALRRQLPAALEPICGERAQECARVVVDNRFREVARKVASR